MASIGLAGGLNNERPPNLVAVLLMPMQQGHLHHQYTENIQI